MASTPTVRSHTRGTRKVPREVRYIAEWPMSASKIQKFVLRKMLETA